MKQDPELYFAGLSTGVSAAQQQGGNDGSTGAPARHQACQAQVYQAQARPASGRAAAGGAATAERVQLLQLQPLQPSAATAAGAAASSNVRLSVGSHTGSLGSDQSVDFDEEDVDFEAQGLSSSA
jgi:hypothetical protein